MKSRKYYSRRIIQILILLGLLYVLVNWRKITFRLGNQCLAVDIVSWDEMHTKLAGHADAGHRPALSFNDHEVAWDGITEKYYLPQNMSEEIWDGLLSSRDGSLFWLEDAYFDKYQEAIAQGHAFTLYCIGDGAWYRCEVVFTGMPVMVIETEDGMEIDREGAVSQGSMWLWDVKSQGKQYQSVGCQVSVRGDSSRGFPKQGYKLVLEKKLSLLGLRNDEDWVMAALWDDDGLIHNKFSYDVWQNMAAHNTVRKDEGTRMEFVELFCNDIYMGVYGLVERMDAKQLGLDKNDILYKCHGFQVADDAIEEDFGLSIAYDIKYPKAYDKDTWIPLKEYLDVCAADVVTDYDKAASFLNMENAIDYNIFMMLTWAEDNNARKNICFVAEYGRDGPRQYQIIKVPWDLNFSWGQSTYDGDFDRKLYHPERIWDPSLWSFDIQAMYQCYPDEIEELTRRRWRELRKDVLSEQRLFTMLDEEFAYLHGSGAYDRNYVRWDEHGRKTWKDEYIYEYVAGRLSYLDSFYEDFQMPEQQE